MTRPFAVLFLPFVALSLMLGGAAVASEVDHSLIPPYVLRGLEDYKANGYASAVRTWLAESPFEAASTLASNIALFKNIEMLAGKYRSYDVLLTQENPSANLVYVRMNYERFPGYILFTSQRRNDRWVLAKIDLHKKQRLGQLR